MPRQSRSSGRSAPARSAPAPRQAAPAPQRAAAPAPVPHQQQQHSNVPAVHQPQQGPGMMGQIAANAASVAIGSTMARGLTNALGWGGGYAAPAEGQSVAPVDAQAQQSSFQQQPQNEACANVAQNIAKCLESTGGDMAPCQYYLDQWKSCQAAAAPY